MLSNKCDKRSKEINIKEKIMRLLVKKGATKKSTWKERPHQNTYPHLPTNECLWPIYESPVCQTDICTGWGSWERVFRRHLFFCWKSLGFKQWPGLCLRVGMLISTTKSQLNSRTNNELILQTNTACVGKSLVYCGFFLCVIDLQCYPKTTKTH